MHIEQIRIYAEVLEQGIDFKEYLEKSDVNCPIVNVYSRKVHGEICETDSIITRLRKSKDADILITAISKGLEYPLLMVEYSTAVPTDDHIMQRSDVYYWGAVFHVPVMKIYSPSKGVGQQFGGGYKIRPEDEMLISRRFGAVFYPIHWQTLNNSDVLETKEYALSCIAYNTEIQKIVNRLIKAFQTNKSHNDFYLFLLSAYDKKVADAALTEYNEKGNLKDLIANSARFQWLGEKIKVKINRFGHAMDPERGVLFFANMLLGAKNVISEIQVNRVFEYNARGGYKSLFDQAPHEDELHGYVKKIISTQNNIFTEENALYIIKTVWNLPLELIEKSCDGNYFITDEKLYDFLKHSSSMAVKSIFYLSTSLVLSDKNRNTICTITWSDKSVRRYLKNIYVVNYTPINIQALTMNSAQEDIVTFCSVEIYKKLNFDLLAVSYPGAQGDRCVLTGCGRKVLRTYIDIIACGNVGGKTTVYLEECKANIINSSKDVKKLQQFISDPEKINGLKALYRKILNKTDSFDIKIGIGAKASTACTPLNADYIFMFDIDNKTTDMTVIRYNVAVIDTGLINVFLPLSDENGKLIGELRYPKIYIIQ